MIENNDVFKTFAMTASGHYRYKIFDFGSTVLPDDPYVKWRLKYPVVVTVFENHEVMKSCIPPPTYIGTKQFTTVDDAMNWIKEFD